ncbi:MAG: aldo/keto reductase [Dehalococcoidia bacterium]|nr:aldo/keto reductase [Dehalococcoidia bacterium]
MEYRRLGNSGLEVSAVGLGTNQFGTKLDAEASAGVVRRAVELGINFVDTADIYGGTRSEEFIGRAINGIRGELVLATKFGGARGEGPNSRGGSRQHILQGVEESLRRLGTDYIDLYQLHFPDPRTPIEETLRALDDLVHQGKVRYIGSSNFAAWQLCEAAWVARTEHLTPFVSEQAEYSLMNRHLEREVAPFCQKYNVGIIPFFPLASGFLTGKYRPDAPAPTGTRIGDNERLRTRTLTEKNFALLAKLEQFAGGHDHTVGELAIAWLLAQPQVSSVIAGATKPDQVTANAKAAAWHLTPTEAGEVTQLLGSAV